MDIFQEYPFGFATTTIQYPHNTLESSTSSVVHIQAFGTPSRCERLTGRTQCPQIGLGYVTQLFDQFGRDRIVAMVVAVVVVVTDVVVVVVTTMIVKIRLIGIERNIIGVALGDSSSLLVLLLSMVVVVVIIIFIIG